MGLVAFAEAMPPSMPVPEGTVVGCDECGNNEEGRAMRTTPKKEMIPATCSLRVKGSLIRMEQAQQATVGAKNVITVASDKGRYCSESWKARISRGSSYNCRLRIAYSIYQRLLYVSNVYINV